MSSRILIDVGHSRSPHVGLGQYAMQYARALLARGGDEFDFRFLTQPGFHAFPASVPGADIVRARFSPAGFFLRLFTRGSSRRVSAETGHILRHALHRNFHPPRGGDCAPFVLTIHDMHFMHGPNPEPVLRQLRRDVARAAAVVFISRHARAAAAERMDFSGKIARVIHNGVEKPAVGRRPAWLDGSRPFLLSLSTVTRHKNQIVLPEMMRFLPDHVLVVAGGRKRPDAEALEQRIRAAGVAERAHVPGAVSEGEKGWLLRHCDGLVFPSLREGFGMPLAEAMHFGKPVFCLKNTALPEVGGDAAHYWQNCQPEHMARVVRENLTPNPRAEKKRREWAAQFSWKKNAEQHVRLYREILAR